MSVINKFLDVMRLNPDEDDYDFDNEDYELEEEAEEESPKENIFTKISLSWKDKDDKKDKDVNNDKDDFKNNHNNLDNKFEHDDLSVKSEKDLDNSDSEIKNTFINKLRKDNTEIKEEIKQSEIKNTKEELNEQENKDVNKERVKPVEQTRSVRTERPKITPISKSRKQANGMEVCVIKPTSIEDEIEITDTLLNGRTVIINMEGIDIELAQRIIDFTSGSTYAIHGNLQKISTYIFLATPNGIDISGDIQNLMETFSLTGLTV